MTAGEIAESFVHMMSQPAISKHLSVLENAGLVWRDKRGINVCYGLKEGTALATVPQRQRGRRQAEEKERASGMNVWQALFCAKWGFAWMCGRRALEWFAHPDDVKRRAAQSRGHASGSGHRGAVPPFAALDGVP
jgi:hypothetical protein